jgi:ABC-type anion transport system duplicated permease subunit
MSLKNLLYTSLTPLLFVEVPELSQEGSFICVLGISNLHISTIYLLNAGTVPTVCYIFFYFIIGYEKKPAELQLLKKNMVVIVFHN